MIKKELKKYNYKNLKDLNRDFQFYINHPDKVKHIQRAVKAHKGKVVSMRDRTNLGHSGEGKRAITKARDLPRTSGFMSIRERKRILKNLF